MLLKTPQLVVAALLLALAAGTVPLVKAITGLELGIESVETTGWAAQGLRLGLLLAPAEDRFRLYAAELVLPEPLGRLEAIRLDCLHGRVGPGGVVCEEARLDLRHAWLEAKLAPGRASFHPGRAWSMAFRGLSFSGAPTSLAVEWDRGAWSVRGRLQGLDLSRLPPRLVALVDPLELSPQGIADLDFAASGRAETPDRVHLRMGLRGGAFSNPASTMAGEDVAFRAELGASRSATRLDWTLDLNWSAGGIYVHPLFIEVDGPAITARASGSWNLSRRELWVTDLRLEHPGVLKAEARGRVALHPSFHIDAATLDLHTGRLPALYETYIQPWVMGTALDDLESEGLVGGQLRWVDGALRSASLTVTDVYADDRAGRWGLYGVDGRLHWRADGAARESRLGFVGGHLFRIDLGAAGLRVGLEPGGVRLLGESRIPVLDGALRIAKLSATGLGGESPELRFDGELLPVSMQRLSTALGWPLLSGTLGGVIPRVRYGDGVLEVGGQLEVRALGGNATLGNLRLQDPLGVAPVLSGDFEMRGLDLEGLTRAFDFGSIEGRLDGHVRDLVLVGWQPVRFDAALYSSPGDRSARRISQRAVDHLARLGTGVGGVLSTGFLGLFESFPYSRIGLSCRLEGDTCHMDGVRPAREGGYVIVEGRLLPRLDVIGYTREVAWRDLVNRLKVIREEGRPVIR